MNIYSINNNSFKGYDARPLKGFLMNSNAYGIANEMKAIGDKEGFKIYSVVKDAICKEGVQEVGTKISDIWAQDIWTILKSNILCEMNNNATKQIKNFFNLQENTAQEKMRVNRDYFENHISGGNIFIVKGQNGDELLVGENELKKFSLSEMQELYNIDKITVLPQMDFHLDLFIRPLDNKKILLTDDKLSLEILKKGYNKFLEFVSNLPQKERKDYLVQDRSFQNLIRDFEYFQKGNINNAKTEDVEKVLKEKGFEVIKVPGRIYETGDYHKADFLYHFCNYMNANVIKNKDGKLVYITNKSSVDDMLKLTPELAEKIGFSFENEFINSISDYVDKDHVYFINGEKDFIKEKLLHGYGGGIHCVCTEVPK